MNVLWLAMRVFLFLLALIMSVVNADQVDRIMVGGYAPVKDISDDRVQNAALFAFGQLASASYSFGATDSTTIEVVKAYQQVVAGMNYRLIIVLKENGDCVGSFAVTVYDQFGNLSVSKWGKEVSCDEARAIQENEDKFHETFASDFEA